MKLLDTKVWRLFAVPPFRVTSHYMFATVLLVSVIVIPTTSSFADCERSTIAPPPETGQPLNIDGLKQNLKYYKCSGAYDRDITEVIDRATVYLLQRAATNDSKLAVVLDIDETSLSNWEEISANDFGFIRHADCDHLPGGPCGFDAWQHKAAAKAIEPTLKLFNLAKSKNIAVFFVTGRVDRDTARPDTEVNLRQAGYSDWTGLLLKGVDDKSSVQAYKSSTRKDIERQGYRIIINIGDQYSDINGGYAERTFKLPNPFYFIP